MSVCTCVPAINRVLPNPYSATTISLSLSLLLRTIQIHTHIDRIESIHFVLFYFLSFHCVPLNFGPVLRSSQHCTTRALKIRPDDQVIVLFYVSAINQLVFLKLFVFIRLEEKLTSEENLIEKKIALINKQETNHIKNYQPRKTQMGKWKWPYRKRYYCSNLKIYKYTKKSQTQQKIHKHIHTRICVKENKVHIWKEKYINIKNRLKIIIVLNWSL